MGNFNNFQQYNQQRQFNPRNNQQYRKDDDYKSQQSIHYFFDLYSQGCDTLYREPKDGMILLRKNNPNEPQSGLLQNKLPDIELVTIIDLSNLWGDKNKLAQRMAEQLQNLNHRNLLNVTRQIQYLDNHVQNGFL